MRLIACCLSATLFLVCATATAQTSDPEPGSAEEQATEPRWDVAVSGFGSELLGDRKGLGVLIATPADAPESTLVASLIRQKLLDSKLAEVVMDDSALGSLDGLSDDEIIEKAQPYPVDVVVVLRTFPGASGPTVVLRVETVGERPRSFRLRPGKRTPWQERPTASLDEESARTAPDSDQSTKTSSGAKALAAAIRQTAVGRAETIRLIDEETSRKVLTFEPRGNFGRVLDIGGDPVAWPTVYQRIGGDELERAWRSRKTVRTTAFLSGGVLAAAGVGLLFVSLTNSTNCSPDNREMCANPAMTGLGALSLSVGAIGVFTGMLISPHPVSADELEQRVDRHNSHLSNR